MEGLNVFYFYKGKEVKLKINVTSTIHEIKKTIIQNISQSSCEEKKQERAPPIDHIDLEVDAEVPQRIMGKYNVMPGLLPRFYDWSVFDDFCFEEGQKFIVTPVYENYEERANQNKSNKSNKTRNARTHNSSPGQKKQDLPTFVYKEEDFPPLGS